MGAATLGLSAPSGFLAWARARIERGVNSGILTVSLDNDFCNTLLSSVSVPQREKYSVRSRGGWLIGSVLPKKKLCRASGCKDTSNASASACDGTPFRSYQQDGALVVVGVQVVMADEITLLFLGPLLEACLDRRQPPRVARSGSES